MRRLRWYEYAIIAAAIYVIFNPKIIRAHDEFHDWLTPDGQSSCCHDKDCRVVRVETTPDGRMIAWYPGVREPLLVPDHIRINRIHSSGRPVLCYDVERKQLYCFSPGAQM